MAYECRNCGGHAPPNYGDERNWCVNCQAEADAGWEASEAAAMARPIEAKALSQELGAIIAKAEAAWDAECLRYTCVHCGANGATEYLKIAPDGALTMHCERCFKSKARRWFFGLVRKSGIELW